MAAIAAQGTTLSVGGETIGNLLSVSPVAVAITTIETSSLDASWKTFMSGLKDGGDCTFEISYDPANSSHQQLETDLLAGVYKTFIITWSDSSTCQFDAILTSFSITAAMDDKLTASFTAKIDGQIVF